MAHQLNYFLPLLAFVLTSVCLEKNQQLYIEPDSYINFKYLTTMFILMTVALLIVLALVVFLNVLIEDFLPSWTVHFFGGAAKNLGDPFGAKGRSISGNFVSGSSARAGKNNHKTGKKASAKGAGNVKKSKQVQKKPPAKKSSIGKDLKVAKGSKNSKAKDSKAKISKVSSSKPIGGSSAHK